MSADYPHCAFVCCLRSGSVREVGIVCLEASSPFSVLGSRAVRGVVQYDGLCFLVDSGEMRARLPAIVIPVVVVLLYLLLPGLKERPWTTLRIGGAILAVGAYIMVVIARIQLGKSFSVRPEAKDLVIHGLYARIRNPMYVFLDMMVFGLIIALHLHWLLVMLAGLVGFQVLQARREADVLHAKFGQAYLNYRKQTWF
jgi:protein-S-isoprenylcysteine O-methyltransferase Ste14